MSRKGNCLDNSLMENFFGIMKNEMFYGHEYEFESLDHLKKEMEEYINDKFKTAHDNQQAFLPEEQKTEYEPVVYLGLYDSVNHMLYNIHLLPMFQ